MQLKPWRDIAIPHNDVLKGTFLDAEFAADLSRVREGTAGDEYGDPVQFFERTYITEGMRLLLDGVVRRLNGLGGDPVIQLQTAFGGGKTHTMLAVYHLAKGEAPVAGLRGIPGILDAAGVSELQKARVAVIDGNRHGPSQPRKRKGITVNCLWGEIAWQIGGEDGFAMVADSDKNGTSPGKEVLVELISKYAPCVVLMDELVAYLRQFQEGKTYAAGTFDSNLSFIQALTEAMTGVKKAVLLGSLPESNTEMGSVMGEKSLAVLEKYFGRVQALWKPVATDEAFEIVRRRLFNPIADLNSAEAVCRSFADMYVDQKDSFPSETQESDYFRRLKEAYPIHPEIFSRLYEDWSSLDGFQRTRGVLKMMAKVIYRLWKDGNRDLMIMPGALPLYDADIKNESIYYLPQGWDPVIEKDIDGERAQTTVIDTQDPRLGAVQAARRAARTIFLGSAPSVRGQVIRGIDAQRIRLGTVQPGVQVSAITDAISRISDKLHYLNTADGRYWFDTRPNLRREMEDRKFRFDKKEHIYPEIKKLLGKILTRGHFDGIHIFTPSGDIPDDFGLRLCVLSPDLVYARERGLARGAAEKLLKTRGEQPRQHQNRLIFLAPGQDSIGRLSEQVRTYLAWQSILDDIENMKINLDMLQVNQVKKQLQSAAGRLNHMACEAYRWVLCPVQHLLPDQTPKKPEWEVFSVSLANKSMTVEIETKLTDEEIIIREWSPIHLNNLLTQWYWKNGQTDMSTAVLWRNMCDYLYMPRLQDATVFQRAIESAIESGDYFAYADGKEDGTYRGLKLGRSGHVVIDQASLLVELETAKAALTPPEPEPAPSAGIDPPVKQPTPASFEEEQQPEPAGTSSRFNRYYGTVELDPHTCRIAFDQVYEEVITLFNQKPGVRVKLRLDVEAESAAGFDENTRRAVRENSNALGFNDSEFE